MGTRSLTVFEDEEGRELAVLYRQFDGYPEGHGQELAELLAGRGVSNGIGAKTALPPFNGAGDIAVRVIAGLKMAVAAADGTPPQTTADWPGNFYLYSAGTRDRGEEYVYSVRGRAGQPVGMKVAEAGDDGKPGPVLFEGKADEYVAWLEGRAAAAE